MNNYCIVKNQKPIEWRLNEDGMLKCTAAVMRSGILEYTIFELDVEDGVLPEHLQDGSVKLYVPPEELRDIESLKTLEGKPASLDHTWQVAGSIDAIGNTAGQAKFNEEAGLVFIDILVEDPATITRIMEAKDNSFEKLVDISAAYRDTTEWTSGLTPEGEAYDGIQRGIEYNHVMLLPKGGGRAGDQVRIYNRKHQPTGVKLVDYTQLKVGNSKIRVHNEDVDKLQNEMDDKDDKIDNAIDPSKLSDTMDQLEQLNQQITDLTSQRDDLQGQLSQVKEQLEAAIDPDTMADAVADAVGEQGDADDILENEGLPNDRKRNDDDDKDRKMNPGDHRNCFGHKLRSQVVNAVRVANGRPEFSKEQQNNEDFIKGCFTVLKQSVKMNTSKKTVNGDALMKTLNSTTHNSALLSHRTAKQRLNGFYYKEATK